MNKQTKSIYHSSFVMLTKLFVNNDISLDEFKDALNLLCTEYRKERDNVK